MNKIRIKRTLSLTIMQVILALTLNGCDIFDNKFYGVTKAPLPGKRVSIITKQRELKPDDIVTKHEIILPKPRYNKEWPQAGGNANHVMHHLRVSSSLQKRWEIDIGSGNSSQRRIISQPIVAEDRIFTMDSETVISAYSMKNGKKIWTSEITPKTEESDYINGGLAYKSNRIYVTTGFGQVVSLAANSGKVLWRQHIGIPMHTAPTAKDNRVFAITVTNKLYALNSETGAILWTHAGIEETTSILGGGSPGVDSGVVIAPYSSGDFFALKVENGQELWSHSLAGGERNQGASSLSAIRGRPIIDRGIVFVISNSGRSVAVNLRTGQRIWEREIGGIESPWVAGDYLFILSSGAKLIALSRLTGQIYWITDLPRWKKPNKQESKITWAGPVLASDRLILAGSAGHVLSVSPYSGKILGRVKIAAGGTISPVIAQESLLLLSNNAKLEIYR